MHELQDHEIANIFPLLPPTELEELANDIQENGLREPIWLHEGKILDGRNRYRACKLRSIYAPTRNYEGDSPTAFVVSLNLRRRHLTPSQSAAVAVEALPYFEKEARLRLKTSTGGAEPRPRQIFDEAETGRATEKAAQSLNTNRQYVSDAKAIKEKSPEIFAQIKSGETTMSAAKRELRRQDLTNRAPSVPSGTFGVLYADPPWKYNDQLAISKNGTGESYGPADAHYPQMSIAELCELPVSLMAEENAVLFLWVTSPLMFEAAPLIRAWGFQYKASFIWDKVKHNMGHYNSVRHEMLLVCTRGSCLPETRKLFDSVQTIERTSKHSQKPEEFRKIIETLYPSSSKLELFARSKTDGWSVYGNEV